MSAMGWCRMKMPPHAAPGVTAAAHGDKRCSGTGASQLCVARAVWHCRVDLPRICIPLAMSPPKRIGGAASAEPLPLLL
jgi:hypothetical protein